MKPSLPSARFLAALAALGAAGAMLSAGCSRSEREPAPPAGAPAPALSATPEPSAPPPPALPPLVIDEAAPTVGAVHPRLTDGALAQARLVDLPAGILLRTPDFALRASDVENEIAGAPTSQREELRRMPFPLVEQMAAEQLLAAEARSAGAPGANAREQIQSHLDALANVVEVSDQQVADFHAANRQLVGDAPLESVALQLRLHLVQEKKQALIDSHIATLALRTPVALSAAWTAEQAERASDNPVDQARASGMPTLANFGADTCIPCQTMAPAREAVKAKVEGRANVVYVHVNKERALASRYGVRGIPLLIFFDRDGREVMRHTGVMSQEDIEAQFAALGVE